MAVLKKHRLVLSHFDSPVGKLDLVSCDNALCLLTFADVEGSSYPGHWAALHFPESQLEEDSKVHETIHKELREYFGKRRKRFYSKIRLEGTDFQLQVWTALRSIPYGETTSYKSVAMTVGNPNATRAVGAAVGRNPVPIIVPCHRVVGEDGKLVGFGGGIERKKKLLQLEGAIIM